MVPGEVVRHLYAARAVHRNEDRSAQFDDSAISKWAVAPKLEYKPAHLQLLRTGQLHFHEPDADARGYHSDRHTERRWSDPIGRPVGGSDRGALAVGEYGKVIFEGGSVCITLYRSLWIRDDLVLVRNRFVEGW